MMGSQIGVTGLAVMGQNLARNIARHGFPVAVHNRTESRTKQLIEHHGDEGDFTPAYSLEEFVAALDRPRRIIIMVKAGAPVDAVIKDLIPLLDAGDIIIDGGNSHYEDTRRRVAELAEHDLHFVGAGISGGEEGALNGPSIMPGGPREAYTPVEPILTAIAAQVDGTPCCAYIGPDGAGHYVKMAHNGIEYADMQLIAEAYDLLTHAAGLSAPEIARVFEQWNEGDLESFLIEITAKVLAHTDETTGGPLVDVILDEAEQKGTGRWTAQSALELGVPVTAITEAVFARALSARKDERTKASKILPGPSAGQAGDDFVDAVRDALYASKVVAYAQGFEQIRAASKEYDWDVQPGTLATIWRGGCIIRARFLDRIKDAYDRDPELSNLLLDDYFRDAVAGAQDAWRKVVRTAVELGVPTPAFSSALAYYDGFRRERGPASLLQGLRDFFGAHTYRRTDREGVFHTLWSEDGREVSAD
ncbi:NADP-dependent phosphogluconate dehydrogenase [Actinoallomurus sp. WRP9H-5]|nr:NADP-dependent phosphogluconate dehydrogenase [Actinoallomurus rhizosphaericola]